MKVTHNTLPNILIGGPYDRQEKGKKVPPSTTKQSLAYSMIHWHIRIVVRAAWWDSTVTPAQQSAFT